MPAAAGLVDFRSPGAVEQRRLLLVAHRGAVGPGVPDNTLAALRAAAAAGYDLVEIDTSLTADGAPVLFHPDREGTMWVSCGVDAPVQRLASAEVATVRYRATDEGIPTLAEALAVCSSHELGVVLDLKVRPATHAFTRQIAQVLEQYGLTGATLLLSEDGEAQAWLGGHVVPVARRDDVRRVIAGQAVPLAGRFWPAFAHRLQETEVAALRANGALVLATVAPRLYPPHAHRTLAAQDLSRLASGGVDAFLIDDEYRDVVKDRLDALGARDRREAARHGDC